MHCSALLIFFVCDVCMCVINLCNYLIIIFIIYISFCFNKLSHFIFFYWNNRYKYVDQDIDFNWILQKKQQKELWSINNNHNSRENSDWNYNYNWDLSRMIINLWSERWLMFGSDRYWRRCHWFIRYRRKRSRWSQSCRWSETRYTY